MSKEIAVILAGQSYTIRQVPIKKAAAWRRRLSEPFAGLVQALEGAEGVELTNMTDIAGIVSTLSGTLIGSIDVLMDLLFEYSPELAADRDRIEAEAYDDEALAAFVEVLKLVYPFGAIRGLVTGSGRSST